MKSEGKSNFLQGNPSVLDIGRTNIGHESKLRSFLLRKWNETFHHRMESFSLKSQHFLGRNKISWFYPFHGCIGKGKAECF